MLINISKRVNSPINNNHHFESNAIPTTTATNQNQQNDDVIIIDEKHDDYVYQVTIKKVYNKQLILDDNNNDLLNTKYKPNTNNSFLFNDTTDNNNKISLSLSTSTTSSNSITNTNSNNRDGLVYTRVKTKQLKYATLEKFIQHLTNQETGQIDSSLAQIFLITYRTFTDTQRAIQMLTQRYEEIVPASLEMTEDVRVEHLKSLRSIIYMWLENYSEDFIDPPQYSNLNELQNFALKHLNTSGGSNSGCLELLQLIQSKFTQYERITNNKIETSLKQSILPLPPVPPPTTTKSKVNHRRSCSNVIPLSTSNSNNSLTNCPTGNVVYLSGSNSNLSKSQLNLAGPFINFFKKSTSNSNITDGSLNIMEANFMSIDSNYFAEQLTYIDKCLFQKICAHLCLGGVWSTRYQKNKSYGSATTTTTTATDPTKSTPILSDKFATIGAFIDQFNIVSFIVQATVLENVDLKPHERAKIIRKWIDIAQVCRNYKNFSSLNAIVQGLNTQCVSRLEKTWNEVSSDHKAQFQELTEMFSEDQNQRIFRKILLEDIKIYSTIYENNLNSTSNTSSELSSRTSSPMSVNKSLTGLNLNTPPSSNSFLEGTAKYADINRGINATLGRKYKETMKQKQAKQKQEPLGTIPFLGTFLKDLEYINAQNPSIKLEKGLINVMQKRKEFEIIAQIKLLQQASQMYNITPNLDFNVWLHKQTIYSEEQNYKFSHLIEPRLDPDLYNNNNNKFNRIISTSRSESVDSLNSNKTSSSTNQSKIQNLTHSRNNSNSGLTSDKDWNADNSSTSNTSNIYDLNNKLTTPTTSQIVVRVNIEPNNSVMYKTIYVKDSDRTKDVKRLILEKFLKNPDTCDNYTLVQVFNNNENDLNNIQQQQQQKDFAINDNCNVFYAAKNVSNMQYVCMQLRLKNANKSDQLINNNDSIILDKAKSNSINRVITDLPPVSPNHNHLHSQQSYNGNSSNNKSNKSWNKFVKKFNS